ncbi:MAG: extracellular solute-binding protein [Cyanophyceae cyanobacterium]
MTQKRSPGVKELPKSPSQSSKSPLESVTRRRFLTGALALGATTLGGCGQSSGQVLRLGAVTGSVPAYLPGAFRRFVRALEEQSTLDVGLEVQSLGAGEAIARTFLQWEATAAGQPPAGLPGWVPFFGRREVAPTDLMLLGDRWLPTAAREGWIKALAMELDRTEAIADRRWAAVMSGGAGDATFGDTFGMPYRWGTTVLVYRQDKEDEMGGPITDWSDLWRPQLQGKVVLLDQAREVIGAVLKSLGRSYDEDNLSVVSDLEERLRALHQQALFYGSTNYLQPLLLGDAWVAMGWSRDVLPILPRRSKLAAVVPQSGSALWADLWVRPTIERELTASSSASQPATAEENSDGNFLEMSQLREEWIRFCWTSDIARRVTLQTTGAAPQFLGGDWGALENDNRNSTSDRIRFPNANVLKKCEFLLPLSDATKQQYQDLWNGIGS